MGARVDTDSEPDRPTPWSALGPRRWAVLALALLPVAALVPGLTLPVVYVRRGFSRDTYSVLTGIADLAQGGNLLLALIVFAFSVAFPVAKLATLFGVLFLRIGERRRSAILRALSLSGRWSMLDVFVVAILVGSIELGILANSEPRDGLYVFAFAILASIAATMTVEHLLAPELDLKVEDALRARNRLGAGTSILACALFLLGLALPLMDVEKWFFWDNEYSVLSGILSLAEEGEPLLAIALLVFIVVLPLVRFVGFAWLHWSERPVRAARAVLLVDKWAMLDVFGLALLVVLVKVGDIASVHLRAGVWLLLCAVSLSLVDSWKLHRELRR